MEVNGATADLLSGARQMVENPNPIVGARKRKPLPKVDPLRQRHAAKKIQAMARGYTTRKTIPNKTKLPALGPIKGAHRHHKHHHHKHHHDHGGEKNDEEATEKVSGQRPPKNTLDSPKNTLGPPLNTTSPKSKPARVLTEAEKKIEAEVLLAHNMLAQVLDTEKGRKILMQEAKILKALREGHSEEIPVQREDPTQPLGIHFSVPSRVSVENWSTHERLIVRDIEADTPSSKTALKVDDVVHQVNGKQCGGIYQFIELIKDQTKFTLTVARYNGVTTEDMRKVREDIEKKVTEFAKKAAQKSQRALMGV